MRIIFFLLFCTPLIAQEAVNTEIFLFDLIAEEDELRLENGKNISENPGYDNQPAFYSDDILLYARTGEGQTDIASYDLKDQKDRLISKTTVGSEYSPVRIPGTKNVAAVRLDTKGLQRLYSYDWETGNSTYIHRDLKIGYFAFFTESIILASVLSGDGMELALLDLTRSSHRTIVGHTGRSLHKIPGTNSMSYTVVNNQKEYDLYLLDKVDREPESFFLTALPPGIQDYVWLDKNRILAGRDNLLLLYDILGDSKWIQIADLSAYTLGNITRIAVNEAGNKIALTAELRGN